MDTAILIVTDWFNDLSKIWEMILFAIGVGWVWMRVMTATDYFLHRNEVTRDNYEGSKGCFGIAAAIIGAVAFFTALWAVGEVIDFII